MSRRYLSLYLFVGLLLYVIWGGIPLIVLAGEFPQYYWTYASCYSGLFLFPCTFFPFIILFMARPIFDYCQILKRYILLKEPIATRLLVLWPIILCLIFTVIGAYFELSGEALGIWEVPLKNDNVSTAEKREYESVERFDKDGKILNYLKDRQNPILDNKAWPTDKSWPQIFFYLRDVRKILDEPMVQERMKSEGIFLDFWDQYVHDREIYKRFLALSKIKSGALRYSISRQWYVGTIIGFSLLLSAGLIFSVFFSTIYLASDGEVAYRETCLSLTAVLLLFLIWLPMRAATIEVKEAVYGNVSYAGEVLLAAVIMMATSALTLSWLYKHKEIVLSLLTILSTVSWGLISILFPQKMAGIFQETRIYLAFSFLSLLPVIATWTFYNLKKMVMEREHSVIRGSTT